MTFLPSQNTARTQITHGFYGTCLNCGLDAEMLWPLVSGVIAGHVGIFDDHAALGIRDYLDSEEGRDLADEVYDWLYTRSPGDAVRRAVATRMERRIRIGHGIAVPELVHRVEDFAISAELALKAEEN